MKLTIYTCFTLVLLVNISIIDRSFATNNNPTPIDTDKYSLVYMSLANEVINSQAIKPGWKEPTLQIYCFQGVPKNWQNIWVSVSMEISLELADYSRYDGATPQEVVTAYEEQNIFWSLGLFSWKDKIIRANPDGGSCVGIRSYNKQYQIFINSQQIDYWKPALLISGIILYLLAPKLSRNTLFYYLCGIVLGLCASLLLVVYFANRFVTLPQGPVMFYGFLAVGSLVGVRVMQMLWGNIRLIVASQWNAVVTYFVVTSLISIGVCYRMGPVKNPRTRNLIQWALQIASLYLMYLSSEFQDAVIVIITVFLIYANFPQGFSQRVAKFWRQQVLTAAPRKHLTLEQYRKEGIEYTAKSLEELRAFCASPACNQWAVVNNSKSPARLAVFVTGSPHVSEEERQHHRIYGAVQNMDLPVQTANAYEVSDDSDSS